MRQWKNSFRKLEKSVHNHPMLSLDKTKDWNAFVQYFDYHSVVGMLKLDGLTCTLHYQNGNLIGAETRGNGQEGEDILHNALVVKNIPNRIDYQEELVIDGEIICTIQDFEPFKNEYANPRNFAAGSIRLLDSNECAKRNLRFYAWNLVKGGYNLHIENLSLLSRLGFTVVPWTAGLDWDTRDYLEQVAREDGLPIDGLVGRFNDIEYGKSLGKTEHHFKNGIAYKRKDDTYKTELIDIDWTVGKSGQITPTAIFKPIEIDGTTVERASVHNISILTKLDLHIGDTIEVYKANQIIPQVKRNVSADERQALGKEPNYIVIPLTCPICGGATEIKQDNDSQVLLCTNDNCKGKLLGKLTHFVSKNAMNIDGISESTLEKFIELGWLNDFKDIYHLKDHYDEMVNLEGFGETSVNKLLNAIEASQDATLDRFLYSLSIPLIGKSASKTIAKYFDGDFERFYTECCILKFNFSILDDFGEAMNESMNKYLNKNFIKIGVLSRYINFAELQTTSNSNNLEGKIFCITGSLEHFTNRDEAKEKIESLGGKVSGSVSAKTNYLVCNEISDSSKCKKAQSLGIKIINEEKLIEMLKQ